MGDAKETVFVVDDDESIRIWIKELVESVGLSVELYASPGDFLEVFDPNRLGCLVTDLRMPQMSGLELQERLRAQGSILPVVMITGYGEVPTAVRALKDGATDFLQKPFSGQVLLDSIHSALATQSERSFEAAVATRLARLTERERETLDAVVAGNPNKVIAADLGISEKAVEERRARVMRKMEAQSLAELVRMVVRATESKTR